MRESFKCLVTSQSDEVYHNKRTVLFSIRFLKIICSNVDFFIFLVI